MHLVSFIFLVLGCNAAAAQGEAPKPPACEIALPTPPPSPALTGLSDSGEEFYSIASLLSFILLYTNANHCAPDIWDDRCPCAICVPSSENQEESLLDEEDWVVLRSEEDEIN